MKLKEFLARGWDVPFFTPDEFDSPDAPGSGAEMMDAEFVMKLSRARGRAGVIFNPTSAYRTAYWNEKVGSRPTSSHRKGCLSSFL